MNLEKIKVANKEYASPRGVNPGNSQLGVLA